ncbi:hypothetical protein COMNV_00667 [Commensalibacter sp. Nvir]|uniref:lysylphosphatidylglycerol synthase domain-containing protein n=1 Tax=Commensalibacter sp. Nvir TaxID=3069817 RepID=UPI002D6AFD65|nr:hypothetical protein COMNV_00667 [Commensalibacter sp. Nvir]
MKRISILLFLIGLGVTIAGVAWIGADSIFKSVFSIGLNHLLLLTLWQIFVIALLSTAWRSICPELGLLRLFWARTLREAAATCLPFSQIGGILLGVRAVCFKEYRFIDNPENLSIAQGISSNIVDVTTETLGQALFTLIGIFIFVSGGYHINLQEINIFGNYVNLKWIIFIGSIFLAAALVPLIWTQRQGCIIFQKIFRWLSAHIAQQWSGKLAANADLLQKSLDQIWSRPQRVIRSCLIHFLCWVMSALGTWACYIFLGAHINILEAITIEALVCVTLSIGFLIPASIGIQEGAYVILGTIFGIDPHLSFGLSILRRARDIIIGVPALAIWQVTEIRYLHKYRQNK